MKLMAEVRKRIQQLEAEIVTQNETIAALERNGRDAREARAIRAKLWLSHESELAEIERLLEEMSAPESQG